MSLPASPHFFVQSATGVPARALLPQWPAPPWVRSLFTTRQGGHSAAPWDSWNLGTHVGDAPEHVQANRQALQTLAAQLSQPGQMAPTPIYLQQVHGCDTFTLDRPPPTATNATAPDEPQADAVLATTAGLVCTVMVADCLPVLFAHRHAPVVAAAHAGWRGLAGQQGNGVLEQCFAHFAQAVTHWQAGVDTPADATDATANTAAVAADTLVWLGPCIGPQAFEVGPEVREAFLDAQHHGPYGRAGAMSRCFTTPSPCARTGHWMADLAGLARLRLQALGLRHQYGNDSSPPWCTVGNDALFFSHRRDAARLGSSGRMAACIWLDGMRHAAPTAPTAER